MERVCHHAGGPRISQRRPERGFSCTHAGDSALNESRRLSNLGWEGPPSSGHLEPGWDLVFERNLGFRISGTAEPTVNTSRIPLGPGHGTGQMVFRPQGSCRRRDGMMPERRLCVSVRPYLVFAISPGPPRRRAVSSDASGPGHLYTEACHSRIVQSALPARKQTGHCLLVVVLMGKGTTHRPSYPHLETYVTCVYKHRCI